MRQETPRSTALSIVLSPRRTTLKRKSVADVTYLLTYAHRSQWSIGHQRPPAIALCSGLLLSFRTSWSPAVSALLQCLASKCCEAGVVEYFGSRINRNRFPKILGYFGTIPIYPAPGGRIFGNLQDISEPPSRRFHMIFWVSRRFQIRVYTLYTFYLLFIHNPNPNLNQKRYSRHLALLSPFYRILTSV